MILRALDVPFDPAKDFARLLANRPAGFLLESAEGPERLARYSILGVDPVAEVRLAEGRLEVEGDAPDPKAGEKPTQYLKRLIDSRAVLDQGYRYLGGLVGAIGYEYAATLEPSVPARGRGEAGPAFEFGLYLDGVVFDRLTRRTLYFSHGEDRGARFEAAMRAETPAPSLAIGEPRSNLDRAGFEKMVVEAKERVGRGDIFQVVLARKIEADYEGSLLAYYEELKRLNPSPYMYYVRFARGREIVGASPEMLVRLDGGRVETFPIAGTRRMGATPEETDALAKELLADEKEAAEHAMLVDLARNDVGRVAEFGTVRVAELRRVERYSHVQHLVSKVEGRLRPGMSAFDALHALFPAGTVSGAPKVEAMKIIRELEPAARGAYAGAVGYFSFNGNADSAIAIRTLVGENGRATVMAGAGIVHDSDPMKEWEETEAKARALVKVMERFRAGPEPSSRGGGKGSP
ncbi:MAG TPA: anthranilate synthase component I family protein [Candidatus Thermoplasmatota archaeon]|nr:anthranilate synthase component I family protein [Candidatus Thermoplasmatota archaeon]